ncbi:hypothetical protein [Hydrocoleum sp. CS-953]|uniref:hypothetical protein n=1 Tax=Hydrocoleum sp. CS-953 TaxID=1671698 RepID=UPI000B9BFA01|nr:hypothetical protein [Hydrocoleum sp. CS-953]
MSNFSKFTATLTKNFAAVCTILTTAYSNPVLAKTPKWSTSATDLQTTAPSLNKKPKNSTPDPDYIIPPRIAADEKISPLTTSLPLNDIPISHLIKWQFNTSFFDDENRGLNTAIQTAAQFLPDVIPDLKGSENAVNSNINRHLFLAANNTRLPSSSFTIYSAGVGRAKSLTPDVTSLRQVPKGNYHSIWLGLSPNIDRSINEGRTFYDPTGPQLAIASAGAEGGAESNVELESAVNQDTFSTANLQDFYAQVYLSFLQQDANFVRESIYREETSYYPHVSFTGNWTGTQDVFRYYTGAIASEEVKFYLGGDSKSTVNGWSFRAGGIGYLNPDRDYYSQLFGNVAKRFRISKNANFSLSTFFNYAIDRDTRIGDIINNSPASELAARARLNWGITSVGVTYYFGHILPNSFEDRLLLDFSIRPLKTVSFSGYVPPVDETSNRSLYGGSLTWRLNNKNNSPTLSLSWKNQEYDYGQDPFGNNLIITDNRVVGK